MQLTFLDLFAIGIVIYFAVKGYQKGFIDDLIGFGGLFLILFIAVQNMYRLTELLYSYFQFNRLVLTIFSLGLILAGGWFLIRNIVKKLQVNINPAKNWVQPDKFVGGLLGAIQGIVLVCVLGMVIYVVPSTGKLKEMRDRSVIVKHALGFTPYVFNAFSIFFPDAKSFTEHLRASLGKEAIQDENAREMLENIEGEELLYPPSRYRDTQPYYGPERRK
jgi:uncharacterized membrane protein required for colicin V production